MIKALCANFLKLTGWKYVGELPNDLRSFIFIGAPHTSNFDFLTAMAVAHRMNRNAKFVIKSEWLKFPLGLVMKPAGAIGLDRQKLKAGNASNTDIMANFFKEFSELILMISPEGTRSPNDQWKTGFYYIAQKAGVPIVLGFADHDKKEMGIGPVVYPQDFERDMKEIMTFYKGIKGRVPAKFLLDSRYS